MTYAAKDWYANIYKMIFHSQAILKFYFVEVVSADYYVVHHNIICIKAPETEQRRGISSIFIDNVFLKHKIRSNGSKACSHYWHQTQWSLKFLQITITKLKNNLSQDMYNFPQRFCINFLTKTTPEKFYIVLFIGNKFSVIFLNEKKNTSKVLHKLSQLTHHLKSFI